MKVKELLEILQKEDPETLVLVDGYEGYYDTTSCVEYLHVKEDPKPEWYFGNYDKCEKEKPNAIKAILLPR